MELNKRILIYIGIIITFLLSTTIANYIAQESSRPNGLKFMFFAIMIMNIIISFLLIKAKIALKIFVGLTVFFTGDILTPILANPPTDYHNNNIYIAIRMIVFGSLISIILWEILFRLYES